jgi:hypothetical protein
MLDEKQGNAAYDMATAHGLAASRNGVHNAAVVPLLGQPGMGDSRTAPRYDGATTFTNIYTVSLNVAFTGAECTVGIAGRVFNVGVWTDDNFRCAMILYVDANNSIIIRRQNVNNQFAWIRDGGGVASSRLRNGETTTDWFLATVTISEAANEMRAFWNGVQEGATVGGLGAWAGNLNPLLCLIGSQNQVPNIVWNGWLAHGFILDYPLQPDGHRTLYDALRSH